jgi:T5SS/PEP-CTERM-associated repeat protein
VTVTGTGSTWNVGGSPSLGTGLAVGGFSTPGPGALVISNGGVVNSTTFTAIGDEADHSSRIVVTGAGSVLNAFNSLQIGDTSCGCNLIGTLTIADGGVVNSPGTTSIGQGSTLNLGVGVLAGAINTPAIANDGQIVADFTDTSTLSANVSGPGTLSKAGSGTLILTTAAIPAAPPSTQAPCSSAMAARADRSPATSPTTASSPSIAPIPIPSAASSPAPAPLRSSAPAPPS